MKPIEVLGAEGTQIDCFIIMTQGEKAIRQFRKNMYGYSGLLQNFDKSSFYHYYPAINMWGHKRTEIDSNKNPLGAVTEADFKKQGPALILDDIVGKGSALSFVKGFLNLHGYQDERIFVFAQFINDMKSNDLFSALSRYFLAPIDFYSERLAQFKKDFPRVLPSF